MRAAVYQKYGGPEVVRVTEVPTPEPRADEIRVRVHAATVSRGDCCARSLQMPRGFAPFARLVFGLRGPRNQILGADLAGVVEAIGYKVTRFRIGERVIALTGMGFGGHAEFRCLRENGAIARLPDSVPFDVAAAIPFGGSTALSYLRDKALLQPGESVLVIGAAGAVGSAAVQLARGFGGNVTAVCGAANANFVKALGAAEVVDYALEDPFAGAKKYDVILDAVGTAQLPGALSALNPGGRLLLVAASLGQLVAAPWLSFGNKKVLAGPAAEKADDLAYLVKLVDEGRFMPIIHQTFPLEKICEAHALVDSRHKRGNVVVLLSK